MEFERVSPASRGPETDKEKDSREDLRNTFERIKTRTIDENSRRKRESGQTDEEREMGNEDFEYANKESIDKFFKSGSWLRIYDAPLETNDIPMTYSKNNSVITALSPENIKYAAPFNVDLEESLKSAGFTLNEGMGVPYSGEAPKGQTDKEAWAKLWQQEKMRRTKEDSKESAMNTEK